MTEDYVHVNPRMTEFAVMRRVRVEDGALIFETENGEGGIGSHRLTGASARVFLWEVMQPMIGALEGRVCRVWVNYDDGNTTIADPQGRP